MNEPILQFFKYEHLRTELKQVSKPFCEHALRIVQELPRNSERTKALDRLLEAKDAAVRAMLYVEERPRPSPPAPPSSST